MIESGAVVTHLLEKFPNHQLIPPLGKRERGLYHKYFFYGELIDTNLSSKLKPAASTVDSLLFDTYKHQYVLHVRQDLFFLFST
jgi:hypothetical protein